MMVPGGLFVYFRGNARRMMSSRVQGHREVPPVRASYTAAMSAANATPERIFRSLAMNEDIYGVIAQDASMIYRDLNLLGYDLITAMKNATDRADIALVDRVLPGDGRHPDFGWSIEAVLPEQGGALHA